MKPRYLYHGSLKKLKGNTLNPRIPEDLDNDKDNTHKGVYATNIKEVAIAMAIITDRCSASLHFNPKHKKYYATVYEGWPSKKYFYFYTLPSTSFKNIPLGSKQWASKTKVKPAKIDRLKIKDYIHLIRKATKKEIDDWSKKYSQPPL